MQKISIVINTTNAAFGDNPLYEAARILNTLVQDFEVEHAPSTKNDINGNKVCFITYEE